MEHKNPVTLSFEQISGRLKEFEFPAADKVIGISKGGVIPACLVAHQLGCELDIIKINYRDKNNTPRFKKPKLIDEFDIHLNSGLNILLVDDVSVTGKTLNYATALLKKNKNKVVTFVFKGNADLVLFPEVEGCIGLPWSLTTSKPVHIS